MHAHAPGVRFEHAVMLVQVCAFRFVCLSKLSSFAQCTRNYVIESFAHSSGPRCGSFKGNDSQSN